jgi:hypothetical protein
LIPCVVAEDVAHRLCGKRKEVRAPVHAKLILPNELEVGLMQKGRRV